MPDRPHILVLMPDTHRGDCLSCTGHPAVRTPNLDALAAEGTRFSTVCTTSPICMPARSSFLSGLFCHNHGQWNNYGHLPAEADTYARRLTAAGYHSCHVGKSHYYPQAAGDHLDRHKPFMNALGWQDVLETTGPYATQHTDSILTDHWRALGLLETFREDYRRRHQVGGAAALWPSPLPAGETMDDFIGRTAVEYVRRYDRDEPLLLFVGFGGPHDPWDAPADWAAKYDVAAMPPPRPVTAPPPWATPEAAAHQRNLQSDGHGFTPEIAARIRTLFYGKVSHIDWWIGQIRDALAQRGMWDNTAVVFWSDHGDMLCDKGRIHKGVFYQGSVDVPMIVRPPRSSPLPARGGQVCDALVSLVDGFPTILELAGCEPKAGTFGRSLLPLLADPRGPNHDAVFSEIDNRTMIRDERYKMVVDNAGAVLKLYDMVDDPDESLNLVGRDDTHDTIRRLRDRLLRWHLATPTRLK